MNILFTEVDNNDIDLVKRNFPSSTTIDYAIKPSSIDKIENKEKIDMICTFIYSNLSEEVLNHFPNLKFIVTRSVGYNHIDLEFTKKNNIKVCNVPEYGSHVIAEHVFALLLSSIRCIEKGNNKIKECNFDFHGLRGIALQEKTLGIIGTGNIGKNVARIASMGFLMNVIAYDKNPDTQTALSSHFEYANSLEEIWEKSDIISLHVPALPSTYHLINDESISKMKNGVVIINTARGELIDTSALIKNIKSNKISYTALDVIENEKNIESYKELLSNDKVLITPHIAFYADTSMKKMYNESFNSLNRFINNEKLLHEVF